MSDQRRVEDSFQTQNVENRIQINELRAKVAGLPKVEDLNGLRSSLTQYVDDAKFGLQAHKNTVESFEARIDELTARVKELDATFSRKANVEQVELVQERGDLLEKMVFNGVTVLVLGLLTLAGAGLFFRAIDTRRVDKEANDVKARADKLEADIRSNQDAISADLTKIREEDLVKLRDSIDKKAQGLGAQMDTRVGNVDKELGKLSVAVSKADHEIKSDLKLKYGRATDRLADVESKVTDLEVTVAEKINVKLDQLDAVVIRMRATAITRMIRQYESVLINAALHTPDDLGLESVSENVALIKELRAAKVTGNVESAQAAELTYLAMIHDCVVGYNRCLRDIPAGGRVSEVETMIAEAQEFDLGSVDGLRRERYQRFDAYLANLKGMLVFRRYMEQSGDERSVLLDEAEEYFEYARKHGSFVRPYSNLAVIILERAQIAAAKAKESVIQHSRKTLHSRTKENRLVIQIQKALWRKLEPLFSRNNKLYPSIEVKENALASEGKSCRPETITTVNRCVMTSQCETCG